MVFKLRKIFFISLLLLLLFTIVSYGLDRGDITSEEIYVPGSNYRLEETLPGGALLMSGLDADGLDKYVVLQNEKIASINLPNDPACQTGTHYEKPRMLPDGRLGLIEFCVRSLEVPVWERGEYTLVAFDLNNRSIEQIMNESFYGESRLGNFTWNPDMTRGVMNEGDLGATLYWLTPEGPKPMNIIVEEGKRSWSLADGLANLTSTELDPDLRNKVGRADKPAWSPDGNTIAFVASPKAVDKEGLARIGVPFNLYFMSPNSLEPEKVLENIYNPLSIKWSPNSSALIIDGCIGLLRRCGLWVYFPQEEKLELVAPGDFWGASWLSDTKIVASFCIDEDIVCQEYSLMKYDISSITE